MPIGRLPVGATKQVNLSIPCICAAITDIFLLPLKRAAYRLPLAWALFTLTGAPVPSVCTMLCMLAGLIQVVDDVVVLVLALIPRALWGGLSWPALALMAARCVYRHHYTARGSILERNHERSSICPSLRLDLYPECESN